MKIFSEYFPLGAEVYPYSSSGQFDTVNIIGVEIPENDKNINLFFFKGHSITTADSLKTGSSIYITANSNVLIENFYIGLEGKTTNEQYDDTVLVCDANDSNIVTDIIIGTNQRFRSFYIENSNNVIIKGSVISETIESRAPLIISESKVIIQNSLIASKSGSNIISQYGTELIQSSNNVYYLSKAENGTNQIQSSVSTSYMDYGFEGNGIYSLSPNIQSTSDTFIGSYSNIFNFNFIGNRSSVTGYNYDCFAPCTLSSTLVSSLSQFPIDFKIKTPILFPLPDYRSNIPGGSSDSSSSGSSSDQSDELLLNINNGNQQTRYFTINGLSISNSIKLNLNNSALTLSNVKTNDGFNIQGTVGKLNIINSTIGFPVSNLKLTSNSTVISNSYIRGEFNSDVVFKGTSYHYDIDNLNIELPIISTFPIDPYQITVNSTINIMIQLGSSTFNDIGIKCQFISINSNEVNSSIPINSDNQCNLPLSVTNEGTTNLKVIISSDTIPSINYYTLIFPPIYSFNNYSLTSGWKFVPSTPVQSNSNFKSYIHLVTSTQIDNQFNKECTKANGCEISSNQIKIESNLPSSSSEYLPIGISTNNPFEPLDINLATGATGKFKNNEIQLYFTSFNPVDSNPSPLSIYLNNQPISILDRSNQQNFKKVIYFENINQLQTVQLSIISRGDIYLTGIAVYSSFIAPIDIPPFSDNFNPKVLYIIIFVGVGLFILSVITIILLFKRHHRIKIKNGKFKLKEIQVNTGHEIEMEEIGMIDQDIADTDASFITNSTVVNGFKYGEHNNDNNYFFNYNNNNNNNINNNYSLNEESAVQFKIEPEIKDNIKNYMNSSRRLNGTFPLNGESSNQVIIMNSTRSNQPRVNNNSSDIYNTSVSIFTSTQRSIWYEWDSDEFPISVSKQTLYFSNTGTKCQIDTTFYDQIQIKNRTDKTIELIIHLPNDNGAGFCTIAKSCLLIGPHQTIDINFAIILLCTTNWYEKFAIQINGFGHIFLLMHLESVVTSKLDYRELEFEKFIGQGSHGTVYKGYWRSQTIAIKIIRINISNVNDAYREMDIMGRVRHQNCVKMIGCVASPENLCIISQFAPLGSLGDLIHKQHVKLTLKQKIRFALDIAVGCQYLHSNGIIHRDLKPENMLIFDLKHESPICVRIADFGTCKEISQLFNTSAKKNMLLTESVGTPIYSSNEVLNKLNYNNSTDVYSFGMSLYELMIEELPFSDHNDQWELPSLIISGIRPTKGMDTFDIDIKSLITKCWNPVASQRPTFDQIVIDLTSISEKL